MDPSAIGVDGHIVGGVSEPAGPYWGGAIIAYQGGVYADQGVYSRKGGALAAGEFADGNNSAKILDGTSGIDLFNNGFDVELATGNHGSTAAYLTDGSLFFARLVCASGAGEFQDFAGNQVILAGGNIGPDYAAIDAKGNVLIDGNLIITNGTISVSGGAFGVGTSDIPMGVYTNR